MNELQITFDLGAHLRDILCDEELSPAAYQQYLSVAFMHTCTDSHFAENDDGEKRLRAMRQIHERLTYLFAKMQ